ncbi:TetR/AcrR family transcriptional regulator [Planococcus beigongshangi]|uniref:TetR/AcrR family transcriptional regulator n=1 Tax=Planococcus beigongshangi TaxID=2782536 RepID=UPI00193AE7FE|nr:TetR/AcrR family transcriptional regulator [Planococcus beigongshangi]
MPKLINIEEKKLDIAHAAWRILLKEGMDGVSVRNTAKEAGITLGALRYYFTTQEELINYTEQLVHASLAEKTAELFMVDLPPREKILKLLNGLLPDRDGKDPAAEARLIFKYHSKYLGSGYKKSEDSVYQAIKSIMSNLMMLNMLKKDVELSLETDRLYALMDGLAMDALLERTGDRPRKYNLMLETHLNSICKE